MVWDGWKQTIECQPSRKKKRECKLLFNVAVVGLRRLHNKEDGSACLQTNTFTLESTAKRGYPIRPDRTTVHSGL